MSAQLKIQIEAQGVAREVAQLQRDNIPRFRDRLIEQLAAQLLEKIQQRTPVETGQARDGWEVQHLALNDEASRAITNHVPYIVFLEEGTNDSRPHHMVKRSLVETPAIVRQIAPIAFRETIGAAQ